MGCQIWLPVWDGVSCGGGSAAASGTQLRELRGRHGGRGLGEGVWAGGERSCYGYVHNPGAAKVNEDIKSIFLVL